MLEQIFGKFEAVSENSWNTWSDYWEMLEQILRKFLSDYGNILKIFKNYVKISDWKLITFWPNFGEV